MNNDCLMNDISSVFGPTVKRIDDAMQSVRNSQDELSKEIERLVTELESYKEIAVPPKIQSSLDKLLNAKERIMSANKLMVRTTERVERIQNELSAIKKPVIF